MIPVFKTKKIIEHEYWSCGVDSCDLLHKNESAAQTCKYRKEAIRVEAISQRENRITSYISHYNAGKTYKEISELMGVTPGYVKQCIKFLKLQERIN